MSTKYSHEQKDALDRARSEVALELRRYSRRLKEAAEINVQRMLKPGDNPVEVGRDAALKALEDSFYSEQSALGEGASA